MVNISFKISVPGKVIISGEHAVVYGYPALLAAANRRLHVNFIGKKLIPRQKEKLDLTNLLKKNFSLEQLKNFLMKELKGRSVIKIGSEVPINNGMGSSAALAVGLAACLAKLTDNWDLTVINELAYRLEKYHHGNPSGGDNTIATYGGFLWYRKEAEFLKMFHSLNPRQKLKDLWLINSGKPQETTKEMVQIVGQKYQKNPQKVNKIFWAMERISRDFLKLLLKEKEYSLKELINENQNLLEELGVVSQKTKDLINRIKKIGGAAKVTGAGGIKSGSGMLLVWCSEKKLLWNLVNKFQLEAFPVVLGTEGVRVD